MATTTNYGWTTPNDTDLVKDGAAAIRTLGSSIDTTTKALNPSTTLGDIEYRSATANTNTRLAIGSTGNVLTVAGGVPTWVAPAGGGDVWTLLSTTTLSSVGSNTVTISGLTSEKILVTIIGASIDGSNGYYYITPTCGTTTGSNGGGISRQGTSTMTGTDEAGNVSIARTANTDSLVYGYAIFTGCKSTSGSKTAIGTGGSNGTGTNEQSFVTGGIINATAALTAITFANTGGNFDGGTLRIYGA